MLKKCLRKGKFFISKILILCLFEIFLDEY